MIQMTPNGNPLMFAGGTLMNECCCGTGALATCNCITGDSNAPRVNVTMTFSGGGTQSWMGCDWTSGETKAVCPDLHQCDISYANSEYWKIGASTGSILFLRVWPWPGSSGFRRWVRFRKDPGGLNTDIIATHFGIPYPAPTSTQTQSQPVNLTPTGTVGIIAASLSLNGVYDISTNQFGQITTNQGLTIKWERGADGTVPWGC